MITTRSPVDRAASRQTLGPLLISLYFTFIGGSFYTDFIFPLRLANFLFVTALLGAWLFRLVARREPWPHTALDRPIAVFVAASLASALLGLAPRYSLERMWTTLVLVLSFYWLVYLKRRGWAPAIARGLLLAAAVVSVIGIVELISWYLGLSWIPGFMQGWPQAAGWANLVPPYLYRVGLPLNGSTALSAYLALLIPVGLGVWLTSERRDDRGALAGWVVLALAVQLLSQSRGGLLALGASLPLLAVGVLRADGGGGFTTRLVAWLRRWWPGVALAALAGLLGMGLWFSVAFAGRAGSTSFRLVLWREAARTFAEHPLVGVGPANFGRALLRRNDPALPRVQNTTAHNVYLNLAAEQGAVGLAAGAYLLSTAGLAWWRQWRLAATRRERIWLVSAGAALAGFTVQSGVDTYTSLPNLLPVAALAAYALSGQSDERPLPSLRITALRRLVRLAPLATLLAACAGQAWIAWGDARFETSVWLASQGQTKAARDQARMAYEIDPDWPLYAFQLAHLEAQGPPQAWPAAIAHYQAGLALEPVHGRHTANLAGVLWRAGDRAAALEMLQLAAASEPDPQYDVNRGLMLEMTGDWPGAIEAYALALARDPSLAESEFWRADAARSEHWPTITQTAANLLGGWHDVDLPRWRLRWAQAASPAGVEAAARAVLGVAPADCEALTALARLALARGQPTEALRQATQAVEANGRCGTAFQVRGAAWAAAGEPGLAEAEWRKALFAGYLLAGFDLGRMAEAQGDLTSAEAHYRNALQPHAVREDIEVTLFGRRAAFDLLPPLIRIGISQQEAAPWLALASLLERQNRTAEANEVYAALAAEDPFVPALRVDD